MQGSQAMEPPCPLINTRCRRQRGQVPFAGPLQLGHLRSPVDLLRASRWESLPHISHGSGTLK